ncbi:MAG TPA: CHAP domain-containing protein [Anaeromyxobacter sp.]
MRPDDPRSAVQGLVAAWAAALALGAVLLAAAPARAEPEAPRDRAVAAARRALGHPFRGDCSAFVISAWRSAGIAPPLGGGRSRSEALHRGAAHVEQPRPGDLAFFHHTYDRNRNGRADDRFTHVALVEAVDGERVTLLHRGARGVERIRMDLAHPSDPDRNDPVRRLRRRDAPGTRVLAGQLFAGYGAVPGADGAPRAEARAGPAGSRPPRAMPARSRRTRPAP